MNSIKGTRTEKNLLKAFAGESQASNRYTIYAKVAADEGYEQISGVFLETAHQEMEHAKRFFSFLEGGPLEIVASYPAGKIGCTEENLIAAIMGENEEWADLYPEFGAVADEEGFKAVGTLFRMVAKVEVEHERRYQTLLDRLKSDTLFKREEEIEWQCRNCGFVHKGKTLPKVCPSCAYPQGYFEPMKHNY
ncbi:MAG: rubrerythrin family protein [Bacteroidales bacterium]|nr:rubrerythrin family protein [Bacteroidales bacterium]